MNSTARDRWIAGLRALFAQGPQTFLKPDSEAVRFVRRTFAEEEDRQSVARSLTDALMFLDSQLRLLSTVGLARKLPDGSFFISDYLATRLFDLWAADWHPKAFAKIALTFVEEYRSVTTPAKPRSKFRAKRL